MNNSKSKRLIGILTALVFVVIAAAILSVILANNKQKGDTAEKINVTTYDYLPLSIDSDGVVTTYVGANDGTAVVDIPASYSLSGQGLPIAGNDYAITKIADNAFKDVNFAFAKIDMANVTSVGTSAFENAKNVYLYGSENGYLIGDYAFRNATVAFDKIVLCADQGGTPSVGVSAFENSSSFDPTITATTIASAKSDPNYVFAEDYTASGTIKASGVSGIISITGTAFQNNGVATSVDFSDFNGILNLGDEAFREATKLGAVKIGKGITSVGDYCFASSTITSFDVASGGATSTPEWVGTFSGCSSLSSATIPSGVTSIGRQAFGGCKSLPSITIPSSVTEIGISAFRSCKSLSSITIPSSVTSIGERAFGSCTSLSSITIPSGVTEIGIYAFQSCTALSSVTLPSSLNSIGACAFSGCSDLTSMTLPFAGSGTYDCRSGETLFGYIFEYTQDQGFYDITQTYETMDSYGGTYETTKTFSLPVGLNSITITKFVPDYAFSGCKYTNNVTLANSVTSIGSYAFESCTSLSSITIPSSVTSIGGGAFQNCTSLSSVTIPSSVQTIGYHAFQSCTSLSSVTLPSSLKTIGNYAFSYCSALSSIFIPGSVSSLGTDIFKGCTKLTSIVFGKTETSVSNGQIAFETNTNLKTFPNISNNATLPNGYPIDFSRDLPKVTSFTFPYAQTQINADLGGSYSTALFTVWDSFDRYIEQIKKITFHFAQSGTWKIWEVNDEGGSNYPAETIRTVSISYSQSYTYYSSDGIIRQLCTKPSSPTNEEEYWYCLTKS